MNLSEIENKWGINLSAISNQGKAEKRFDFVIKTTANIYGIETNFYGGGGSKLNETARSYKALALEAETIGGFKLKEIIMKEQHNCRATGYWKTNSIKYNFLLLAHEYLFVFYKK